MNIKAINFIDTHCAGPLREARMQSLTDLLEEVRTEQRETIAAWMIYNGFATGHGDTIEDLLEELREQIEELRNGS